MSAVPFVVALMTEDAFTARARVGHYKEQMQVALDTLKGALNNRIQTVSEVTE